MLESGESLGSTQTLTSSKSEPFYNPHLLVTDSERIELQKHFFLRLLENIPCYLFNSGVASADDIKKIITGEAEAQS